MHSDDDAPSPGPGQPESGGPLCSGPSWVPAWPWWRETIILTYAAVALTVVHYHSSFGLFPPDQRLFEWFGLNFLALFVVPVLIIHLGFRQPLADFGLRLGRPAVWLRYLLAFTLVMAPVAVIASRIPEFAAYYPRYAPAREAPQLLLLSMAGWLVYFLAWEFFFRGFLLFGLGQRLGAVAIVIQMVPFTMAHLPKPELEAFAAIIAGLALGVMAWRGKSCVGPWLVHWLAATMVDVLCVVWPPS